MARLYSNENFPLPAVIELRRLGHDVLTVLEAGKAEQAIQDDEVLAFATEQGRAVLTINRKHFISLLYIVVSQTTLALSFALSMQILRGKPNELMRR